MKFVQKVCWIALVSMVISNPHVSFGIANEDALIRGTAQFLMDRAQAIMLERYLRKVADNKFLGENFIKTVTYLKNTNFLAWTIGDGFKENFKLDIQAVSLSLKNDEKNKSNDLVKKLDQSANSSTKPSDNAKDKQFSFINNIAIINQLLSSSKKYSSEDLDRAKKSLIFFAALAEAKDSRSVQEILNAAAMSRNSYQTKRDDTFSINLSGYLGIMGGLTKDTFIYSPAKLKKTNSYDYIHYGIFAPIGLDFSFNPLYNTSFSLMISAFDLGNVVNAELRGFDQKFTFKEIIAPGAYLIWGLNNSPLAIGAGVQTGLRFKSNNSADLNDREWRYTVFFALDIPLFNLY